MPKYTLCTEHLKKQKNSLALGSKYTALITVTHDDGEVEEFELSEDLCETDAIAYTRLIDYIENKQRSKLLPPDPPPPPPAPLPKREPKADDDRPEETPDTWSCGDCMRKVKSARRGPHAKEHGKASHEIKWQPLFDVSDWEQCECGHRVKSLEGMKQHTKKYGHHRRLRIAPVEPDEMKTNTGAALATAVNGTK